jgi:integrase/recombinase XerD
MIEDMQIRNLAPRTQISYVEQVDRFARHFRKSPERLGTAEIRAWQLYLAQDKRLAASSISLAVAALRFLYTVTLRREWTIKDDIPTCRKPRQLPEVLSPAEVAAFLDAVKIPKQRVILTVCYAAGLRVSEAVRLKPAAIDSQRMVIRVEAGKGRKDRYVMLSPRLLNILRDYWKTARPKEWLFAGRRSGEPITTYAVEDACRGARAIRHHAANHAALSAPRIRSSPAEVRHRSADHPTPARSQQSRYHVKVSAHRHHQGLRHRQPTGRAASDNTGRAGSRARLTAPPCPARGWKWRMCSATSARLSVISTARRCPLRAGAP